MTHQRTVCSMILLLSLTCPTSPQAYGQLPIVRIGIVSDGYWERNDEIRNLFQKEILELTHGD